MYIIIENDKNAEKVSDLIEFYVDNFLNSTKENAVEDIKDLINGKNIIEVLKSYNLEIYEVKK